LPDPASSLAVSNYSTVFPACRSPVPLRVRVHPLVSFASSSEYVAAFYLPFARRLRAPTRVSFPIATSNREVHLPTSFPTLACVPPPAFHTLSTAYSFTILAGLFHPATTSGINSPGVFPAAKSPRLIGEPYPHVVTGILLPVSYPTGASSSHPDFRVLLRAAIRCDRSAFKLNQSLDPLLGFQLPRALLRTPWQRLHAASAHGLSRLALTVRSTLAFSVSIGARPDFLSPDCHSRSSFATFPSAPPKRHFQARSELPGDPLRPPNSHE
jgi:hypothetical protein